MTASGFWSPAVFRILGFRVRLHLFLLLLAGALLLKAALAQPPHLGEAAWGLGILFASVLLAEIARGLACRRMGGESDEIVLWPLGSLSSGRIPPDPRAHFWTAFWAPAANGILAALSAAWLGAEDRLPGDPLAWGDPVRTAYRINLALSVFGFLPAFPLPGGQMLRAALWRRMGFESATRIAVRVGMAAAVLLGILGIVIQSWVLVLIAVLNFVACEQERRLLADHPMGPESWLPSWTPPAEPGWLERLQASRRERRERDRFAREARLRAGVDAILDRINRVGMNGLTEEERRTLREASDVFKQNRS